jgi:hypothetical protein
MILLATAVIAVACSDGPPSTKVDGRRVFQIEDSGCHGDCPAPWSIVTIGGVTYQNSCTPVRPSAKRGDLYAVRRGNDLQHDWVEARVINGFDPRIVLAARRNKYLCEGDDWFVAHVLTTPTNRNDAASLARALCNAGTTPVYESWRKKCADGGPFEWFSDDGGGSVWLSPTTTSIP